MRHWYLLAKELVRPNGPDVSASFVAGGGPDSYEVTDGGVKRRLFLLGVIEFLPMAGSIGLGICFAPTFPVPAAVAIGLALSVLTCWLLRHQTPPTVIHAAPGGIASTGEADDTTTSAS
jgi:hypothetical protein